MQRSSELAELVIEKGMCYVVFAYDIGAGIDLDEADRRILSGKDRGRILRKRPAPQYFEYRPPPLRIVQDSEPVSIADRTTHPGVDVVLYDFGAVSVIYRIGVEGPFSALLPLSEALYENVALLEHSRQRVESVLAAIRPAVEKANISSFVEDYTMFHLEACSPPIAPEELATTLVQDVAQILRCEREPLSAQEVREATSSTISFGRQDITIIDWNAALIFGSEMEDVRAVLEFANVELLERRFLDQQLDDALDEAYEALSRREWERVRWPGSFQADLRRIAQMQVDSAILFERVTNALKLLGDQYLARVYRAASQRFHLEGWDASILRKLQTLESIYGKLADQTGNRRMEVLEWIIIILIAVSIILSFIPGFPG
ncbi:MAG: hypothetical protein D6690_05925 [Nitrospirae bacterium]|nr:MAG: hypothetical protein D6690_05925 [Nitrospirota bacterium]